MSAEPAGLRRAPTPELIICEASKVVELLSEVEGRHACLI